MLCFEACGNFFRGESGLIMHWSRKRRCFEECERLDAARLEAARSKVPEEPGSNPAPGSQRLTPVEEAQSTPVGQRTCAQSAILFAAYWNGLIPHCGYVRREYFVVAKSQGKNDGKQGKR